MKVIEVIQLLKAGYTKAEIDELRAAEGALDPEPPKELPAGDPEPPAEDPEPAAGDPHYVDEISKLTKQIETLTATMQEHFRNGAEGTPPDPAAGEQVLKDILEKGVI